MQGSERKERGIKTGGRITVGIKKLEEFWEWGLCRAGQRWATPEPNGAQGQRKSPRRVCFLGHTSKERGGCPEALGPGLAPPPLEGPVDRVGDGRDLGSALRALMKPAGQRGGCPSSRSQGSCAAGSEQEACARRGTSVRP